MENRSQQGLRQNRVLLHGFKRSGNFFESDRIFAEYLGRHLPADVQAYMQGKLQRLGQQAATEMDSLSLNADHQGPVLVKRDAYGETIDEIRFHPDYHRLMEIAVHSEMMRVKWAPELRTRFAGKRHSAGFSAGYLYGMAESGQYCPLCMTDGVALLVDRFAEDEDRERLLPHIATDQPAEFFTGAMFLTEKAGGSDVGANLVEAKHVGGKRYRLYGEKWFCSNVNAQIIFALARTRPDLAGTKGLSIFLVEPQLPDGARNPLGIVRLKDKLGVRSMASGECLLDGTEATLIGEEFQGFRIMAEMINLSRLYNSVAALSGGRRALVEAWQFLNFRETFGKNALDHALVRAKFWELGAVHLAHFHMVWRAIRALDAAEQGNGEEAELLRVLTPMIKRSSAEASVYLARESMELMGGMGYIEDTVMPKIMRDMMVLPIWEGAGNIMVLDMLRAATKSHGLGVMLNEIRALVADHKRGHLILDQANQAVGQLQELAGLPQDEMEWKAKQHFLALTSAYQCALLLAEESESGRAETALDWLLHAHVHPHPASSPPDKAAVAHLIGWQF